jgi:hypothetical protein
MSMIRRSLMLLLACATMLGAYEPSSATPNEPAAMLDTALIRKAHGNLRAWADYVRSTSVHGVIHSKNARTHDQAPFRYDDLVLEGGIKADMKHGSAGWETATLFQAFEITGDSLFLRVALDFCEFLLKAQEPEGHWAMAYVVTPDGRASCPRHRLKMRFQDAYQYGGFSVLLNAWRITGDSRYYDAARRNADVVLSLQNPNGSWPDYWDLDKRAEEGPLSDGGGVRVGGSYNDGATSDGMRQMLTMYHLTGDAKYVDRIGGIGQWLFDTRLGEGEVWGWCQQYGADNKPIAARHFEPAVIGPRTYNRFVLPLSAWFYALSGEERYFELMKNGYRWLRSVEQADGWAYQYLPDGSPIFSFRYDLFRMDAPETWPSDSAMKDHRWVKAYTRDKVHLGSAENVIALIDSAGVEGLRRAIRGPEPTDEWFALVRTEALERATRERVRDAVRAGFRLGDTMRSSTQSIHPSLQLLFDVKVAAGEVVPRDLVRRWSGLTRGVIPSYGRFMGGWTQQAVAVDDWLDMPMGDAAHE